MILEEVASIHSFPLEASIERSIFSYKKIVTLTQCYEYFGKKVDNAVTIMHAVDFEENFPNVTILK